MEKALLVVGARGDLVISGSGVAESHAKLEYKSGRVFCTALLGEFMTDPTLTWIDGTELRPGVAYMVAPGASIAFGSADNSITLDFTEASAGNALADVLMKGMASQASSEVQEQARNLGL